MDNIIVPSESFDFSQITLDNPAPLNGGSFFTKIKFTEKGLPLYVQYPKCLSKNGFNKNTTSKKTFIDLQFNFFETDILTWMENLENRCRQLIYEKRELWFQSEMGEEDIENIFISPIKPYKSGKFLIIRSYIPTSKHIKQEGCLIYDENERTLGYDSINERTQFIPLAHIEGIKFSSKSFQIEINIRQIMVLSLEDNIKKSCLIKNSKHNTLENIESKLENNEYKLEDSENSNKKDLENLETKFENNENNENYENNENDLETINSTLETLESSKESKQEVFINTTEDLSENDKNIELNNNDDLCEIDLDLDNLDIEEVSLKKPKDVYYEIYKAAYDKAKQIKKAAIEAHIEAKNLKIKYNLDDIVHSEDEIESFSDI